MPILEKEAEARKAPPQKAADSFTRGGDARALRNRSWVLLTVMLNTVYLYWRIRYTLPLEYGTISIIAGVALLAVEVLGALESLVHYFNMHRIENHPVPDVPPELFPEVDVFIATYAEPEELLYKTVNGCKYMEYPDPAKVHIYLCDDGNRSEIRRLAREMGIRYIGRSDNTGAKAGNLNNALARTSAPLIVTLDADMIPQRTFLMHCVPYFVDAELKNKTRSEKDKIRMGFVQTPQSFYNPDLFQFFLYSENRIPNEQDYFYKDIQVSRNRSNSVIYGGSNTVLSRAAIEDIGGFYQGAITEDFATGILLQKKKYTCYAINEVLASGLSPTDLPGLIQQRIRWARGCIQTGRKLHILFTPKLTMGQKANYWASIWYWFGPVKRLIYIMSPILFAVFGFMVIKCTLPEVLIFWLPMYLSSNVTLRMLSQGIRSTKWTNVYETVLFPFLFFPVLAESLGFSLKKFQVTRKDGGRDGVRDALYAVPFALFIGLSVLGIFNCVTMIFRSGSIAPIAVLFWLSVNLFNLVMSLFFVLGRGYLRMNERVEAEVDCLLSIGAFRDLSCVTKDFSETGIAVRLSGPIDIDDKEEAEILLKTEHYTARLKARAVHIGPIPGGWKCSFFITDYGQSKGEYMQMLYDRVPCLPTTLHKSHSIFDDLRLNLVRRTRAVLYQNRRHARVSLDVSVPSDLGRAVHIDNFDYKYLATDTMNLPPEFSLQLREGLTLRCAFERNLPGGKKLYAVANYDALHNDERASARLSQWLEWAMKQGTPTEEAPAARPRYAELEDCLLGVGPADREKSDA